jgi:hypothetical protein
MPPNVRTVGALASSRSHGRVLGVDVEHRDIHRVDETRTKTSCREKHVNVADTQIRDWILCSMWT